MSSTRRQHRHDFRPKLIALSVAACFSLSSGQSQANPTGGTVASGSASFAASGNTLTVANSANAIINWASFSIGVNEITRFLQSSGSSAVLNRVVGANGVIPQSVIDGILSSNGRVFLLNQSGILIGSTARIDVAGFVASSLNLSDQDFLTGRLRFTETPGAGAVSNAGVIDTGAGGRVFLVAPDVQNSGIIRSPQGEIVLAAGKSVELVSESSPFVTVNITADSEQALNVGQLISESGRIGMFGALVRQGGVVEANSAVAGANGEIRLVATKDLTLDAGSRTTANGPSGGNVLLQAQGGTNLIYGTVEATGSSGQGGSIQALGVRVGVLGSGVIDASGDAGGGTVLVGGDRHGDNPNVQNAQQTLIGPDGVIRADAGTSGDGGRVIVWSDAETRAFGSISAQGGAQSGNGGFVETSSAGGMDLTGVRVDTRAANGQWGTWLLDPTNVTIVASGGTSLVTDVDNFADPTVDATINSGTIEGAFAANGTVQIQATNDVNFATDLNLSYGTPQPIGFEVRAVNNIDMAYAGGAHTIFTNGHDVTLSANDVGVGAAGGPALNIASGTGSIVGGGNIIASYGGGIGGNITLSGYGVNVGTLQTAGGLDTRTGGLTGNVTITALNGGVQTGGITTRGVDGANFNAGQVIPPTAGASGGSITISVAYGSVMTGNIEASGGRGGDGGYAGGLIFEGASGGNGGNTTIGGLLLGNLTVDPASIATGSITSYGGNGGAGGGGASVTFTINTIQVGYGGVGGGGGIVNLAGGNVTTGDVTLKGGAGGAGGSNITATVYGTAGSVDQGAIDIGLGGNGGAGGSANLNGGSISTGNIAATGGAGAAGGGSGNATSIVNASGAATQVNGIATSGSGGRGGNGGFVSISGTGAITIGTINASGTAGGAGGANGAATVGAYGQSYASFVFATADSGAGGFGGSPGSVNLQSAGGGTITTGAISISGGAGGAGGANSTASAYASSLVAATLFPSVRAGVGGSGGGFGNLFIYGGDISVGAITTTGGLGGAGATGTVAQGDSFGSGAVVLTIENGSGGHGGAGGSVSIDGNTISTGPITTRGGDGADGTSATGSLAYGGNGGDGAEGGSISLTAPVRVTIAGAIDATGGRGGNGGSSAAGYGGRGGGGGNNSFVSIFIDPDSASAGSIAAAGGAGGNGGNGGIQGGDGGAAGSGALFEVSSLTYGGVALGNIDVSGASGGAGGSSGGGAGFYGGAGGAGGSGGYAFAFGGSIDLLSGGTILATGGGGGPGGAASAGYGGNGGIGGNGGVVELFAESAPGAYGTIQVGALNANVTAGLGGAGGVSGGLAGVNGVDGTILIFGDINLFTSSLELDLASRTAENSVDEATREINTILDSLEEIEKKNKENKQKKEVVCK